MESSVAEGTFVSLDEDEAYAGTSREELQLIVKQMENFKSLKITDIEPENQDCEICFERFGPSVHRGASEEPVQLLSCGHVFGHVCLSTWLAKLMPGGRWWNWNVPDAFWPWSSDDEFRERDEKSFHEAIQHTNVDDVSIAFQEDGQRKRDWRNYLNWDSDNLEDLVPVPRPQHLDEVCNADCPKCRASFSISNSGVMWAKIEPRLHFWDLLYEKVGISRSAKEEQARNVLMRYVQMVQAVVPRMKIKPEFMRPFTLRAQVSAMRFALRRGNRSLDPLQSYLRDAIFNLGCYGLHEGEYRADSYENRRIPIWCYQVDRIERGLSPTIPAVMHWRHIGPAEGTRTLELVESTEGFYRDLRQQTSGSWRRTLFAEAGADGEGFR